MWVEPEADLGPALGGACAAGLPGREYSADYAAAEQFTYSEATRERRLDAAVCERPASPRGAGIQI